MFYLCCGFLSFFVFYFNFPHGTLTLFKYAMVSGSVVCKDKMFLHRPICVIKVTKQCHDVGFPGKLGALHSLPLLKSLGEVGASLPLPSLHNSNLYDWGYCM